MSRFFAVRGFVAACLCSGLVACSAERHIIQTHNSPHTEQVEKEINLDEDAAGPPKSPSGNIGQNKNDQDEK